MTGLTRTQLQRWTVEHLRAAASNWNDVADLWENSFESAHTETKRPGGTEWAGDAADAAQDHSWRDLVHARGSAESLRAAAKIASVGAADIDGAHRAALSAIADAEADEFVVGDDLSVSEPPYRQLMRQTAARAAAAQQHADNIGYAANNLMSAENHTSQRLTAVTASLREPLPQTEEMEPGEDGEGGNEWGGGPGGPQIPSLPEGGVRAKPEPKAEPKPEPEPAPAEPPWPPPPAITGMTVHGGDQVAGRDGHGVNDTALNDAVAHPTTPPQYQPDRDVYLYLGKDAAVVLNQNGQVVTAWSRNSNGWRNP